MKIAFTGNPNYGIAQAWHQTTTNSYTEDLYKTDFFSRENGWGLDTASKRREFAQHISNYDVFINNSALYHFHQVNLLKDVYEYWDSIEKFGRIINIGSTADRNNKATSWVYPTEKKALREYSLSLSQRSIWENHPIKVTYLSFGSLQTKQVSEKHPDRTLMSLDVVCDVIKQMLLQDTNCLISEYRIDPIQQNNT